MENTHLFTTVEDARNRLEAILGGTSDAILVTDDENRILLLNDAAFQFLDLGVSAAVGQILDASAAVGQSAFEVVPNEELRYLFSKAAGGEVNLQAEVPSSDGRTFNAHLTRVPEIGYVVVMQNITHLKELERLKNEFVSTASHDLRSPLTSIRGFVDLLEMVGPLNEQQKTFTEKIRKGVIDITTLIEDLLDLGRIEAGTAFEFEPVSLGEVIAESVESLRGQAVSKNQRLEIYMPPTLPYVLGNRLRLNQVVNNLIGNAVKYTPDGGDVQIWSEQQDGQLLVHVRDTGIGISAEDQEKLFQKFYRVKSRETEDIPGTGLGLAITKSIVERHGGRIWVSSELGKGSTFTFLLPAHERRKG
jgi:two-component system NtrC family sensor kinase